MSNLAQVMASPKTLRDWCSVTCACYPNVDIKNMSTSFRDGLAFCAIIHRHRPDLIDFSSLSKDNVYQNNKLAFEVAETKLGIPALLDPDDMVSTKVPDCLSIITYLSQYYYFFNRKSYAGLASLRSPSHVTNNLKKSKTPDGLNPLKSSTDLETSREVRLSKTRPRTVCSLCFKPVHLIQRHLIDGRVYHRRCFRCKVCHGTLLPGSYTQGSNAGFLICTHHRTDSGSTRAELNQQIAPSDSRLKSAFQESYFSLGGMAVFSIPHYTKQSESQDRLVCKTAEGRERQERSREAEERENRKCMVKKPAHPPPPPPPPPSVDNRTVEEAGKVGAAPSRADIKTQREPITTQESCELPSACEQVTLGSTRPVPAPRRILDSSGVPVPAARTKTLQTMNSPPASGNSSNQNKISASSSRITSPTSVSPKVTTSHPWLNIIHPGPWTQLPPAPAPVPAPRSKSVSKLRYRPKVPAPNPFEEDLDEEGGTKPEHADQTESSTAAVSPGGGGNLEGVTNTVGTSSEPVRDTSQIGISDLDELRNTGGSLPDVTEGAAAGPHGNSEEAQSHILPRSLSVPAITHAHCQSSFISVDTTETNEYAQVTSCQSKLACKENPFDRKPEMTKSKTFQALPSRRAAAPGHGFPLIKRKVQTDQNVSTEDLQVQKSELDEHLEELERRGVELERNLRDCKNDEEEVHMLTEWFSLIHEHHVLVRRDTELVHLTKQQKLEERQADVEYELRCLLNKPEIDWSPEDRGQEQQLMDELVGIIEQRNQIVSSLDQDRQREREEDMLLEEMMKNKEYQKEELKELKKSKGKFKPTKVFKMLNHKTESTKNSMDKKS